MKKTKMLKVRMTEEQVNILKARTISSGYLTVASYIRSFLFIKQPLQEQLEELIDTLKTKQK
ncbi:MAG: hypothetical protein KJ771_07330 [Nanoarchaeota archaeon]|nr:hypothetical protein [Nanoarchaeota archaeon]